MNGAWCEVDLSVLRENIRSVRSVLNEHTEIIFVVKANAYGHGLVPVARCAAEEGVRWFAVAYVEEAIQLRQALNDVHILVMGAVFPEAAPTLIEHAITPIVVSEGHGRALSKEAVKAKGTLEVHLKIDTGMGRLGIQWDQAETVLPNLFGLKGIDIKGVCTHFATIEPMRSESAYTQMHRFEKVDTFIQGICGRKLFRHVSSSRAFLYYSKWDYDAVRPGIVLYGYGAGDKRLRFHTHPIMQWKTRVVQVKSVPEDFPVGYYSSYVTTEPTDLATIAVGYADGYLRLLSNRGFVLINGRRCPVVGRISMNWVTVDLGPDSGVKAGGEVVLMGAQGEEELWGDEIARQSRTIAYEVLTSINPMAERRYVSAS